MNVFAAFLSTLLLKSIKYTLSKKDVNLYRHHRFLNILVFTAVFDPTPIAVGVENPHKFWMSRQPRNVRQTIVYFFLVGCARDLQNLTTKCDFPIGYSIPLVGRSHFVARFCKWRAQPHTRKKYTIVDRFPLPPPVSPPIGHSFTHVIGLAAHSTTPPTPTAMGNHL
jgi:hypothetical protein